MKETPESPLVATIEELKGQLEKYHENGFDFYKEIYNNLKIGISIITPDGLFYDVNERLCEVLGCKRTELIGKSAVDFFTSESKNDVITNKRLSSDSVYQASIVLKNNKKIWLELYGQNCNINTNPYRIAAIRDITPQKLLEEEQRIIESQYQLLFENMNEAFALHKIIVDEANKPIDYIYLNVNSVFEKVTGLKKEDIINKRVKELMPNTESYWIENFGNVAITGQPISFSNFSVELNRYFETRAYAPQKGYFAVIFSDITERRKDTIELELHNKRLELLVQLSALKVNSMSMLMDRACFELLTFLGCNNGFLYLKNANSNYETVNVYLNNKPIQLIEDQNHDIIERINKINKDTFVQIDRNNPITILFESKIQKRKFTEEHLICFSSKPANKAKLSFCVWIPKKFDLSNYHKHIEILLEDIWHLIEKHTYLEQILKEKEKAEITESRFDEIQKAGRIGWYEAVLDKGLFMGSHETYNIFFDEYYDYPVKTEDLIEALHPDDRATFFNTVQNNVRAKVPSFEWEYRIISKKLGVKHVYSKAFLKYNKKGELIRRYGIVQDITAQKKIELELKQHNDRLESLIQIAQLNPQNSNELIDVALVEALKLTFSEIGIIFRYHNDIKNFTIDSFSKEYLNEQQIIKFINALIKQNKEVIKDFAQEQKIYINNSFNYEQSALKSLLGNSLKATNVMLIPRKIYF